MPLYVYKDHIVMLAKEDKGDAILGVQLIVEGISTVVHQNALH